MMGKQTEEAIGFVRLGSLLEAMPLNTQPEGGPWSLSTLQLWFMEREHVCKSRAMLTPRKEWRRWPSAGLPKGPSPWGQHRHADATQPSPLYLQPLLKGEHLIYRFKSHRSIGQSSRAQQPAQGKVTAVTSLSYLRSFLLLRNNFLVCAISASWGIGW